MRIYNLKKDPMILCKHYKVKINGWDKQIYETDFPCPSAKSTMRCFPCWNYIGPPPKNEITSAEKSYADNDCWRLREVEDEKAREAWLKVYRILATELG